MVFKTGGMCWAIMNYQLSISIIYLLLITYYLLPITYYLLPITYYLLPITYYLLPITYYLLPITYYLLPITYINYLSPNTYYLFCDFDVPWYLSFFQGKLTFTCCIYFEIINY